MSETAYTKLQWIAERAAQHPEEPFRNLACLIDVDFLRAAFYQLNPKSAPGCDKQTWHDYEANLEENLPDLHERLKTQRYRAQPVKRIWLDKEDGKKRPIGIPALEDKVVQKAVAMILEAIWEKEFQPFSHGFRPGHSPQRALGELRAQCLGLNINWILDADISGFFDNLDHKLLMEFLRRRVVDKSLLRLIGKWLHVGVIEAEQLERSRKGTPQGCVISPILSNIFLHYVLDEWVVRSEQARIRGGYCVVRFADDFVIGFQTRREAVRLKDALSERFAQHNLTLHPEKTRLIQFGKPLKGNESGKSGNGTFDFLGFTHYWARTRWGGWTIKRKTAAKRKSRAMKAIWAWCRANRHGPITWQYQKLCKKLQGHYGYYGVPCNIAALQAVLESAKRAWHYWLSRRSQRSYIPWEKFNRFLGQHPLPRPRIVHGDI